MLNIRANSALSPRPYIPFSCPNKPPSRDNDCQRSPNQTGIIHRLRIRRQVVWEAVNDEPDDDITACDSVENRTEHAFQLESAVSDVLAAGQEVGQDSCAIASRAHEDETADERIERCCAADVDAVELSV